MPALRGTVRLQQSALHTHCLTKTEEKMQNRHSDRSQYFRELAFTSKEYFIPYLQRWHSLSAGTEVLEIGCGEGGNLLPFARMGCRTTGIDISVRRIEEANRFFRLHHATGAFIAADFFKFSATGDNPSQPNPSPKASAGRYDIIICHDVLEHIHQQATFLSRVRDLLKPNGVAFFSFPAWQMPFGGHQQICRHRLLSHLPFIHLLPAGIYRTLLRLAGESPDTVAELLDIKQTGVTIERFERQARAARLSILHRQLWLINPHYQIKFKLPPRRLPSLISRLPYLRNFFCTTCFYILSPTE